MKINSKEKYTIKKILKNCVFPEGLYELKDKETKFYLILEDKVNVEKLEDYLIDKDHKIADLQKKLDQANEKLKGAIIPKFKIGQEVYKVYTREQLFPFKVKVVGFKVTLTANVSSVLYAIKENGFEMGWHPEKILFATLEEAEKKLQELRGGE